MHLLLMHLHNLLSCCRISVIFFSPIPYLVAVVRVANAGVDAGTLDVAVDVAEEGK